MSEVSKNIFEGAGFLLTYKSYFVLATRIKKAGDNDPIEDVEYMGGKVEGQETPYQTAYNELVEECGGDPLEPGWDKRCNELCTFQPFSKKWIWCLQLELTDTELANLTSLDTNLDTWPIDEQRDFSAVTHRSEKSRKAVQGIFLAPKEAVKRYFLDFCAVPASGNRMKDAKAYGSNQDILFECFRLSDSNTKCRRRLRGFNLVVFETHKDYLANL